jgi:nucleoside-diphosphate-sugar epimerase
VTVSGGTVIITGASGLIGAAAAARLASDFTVVAFDNPGPPHPPPGIETVGVDLTSDDSVRDGFRRVRERHGSRVASLLHFGAYYDFRGRPSPRYDEINVRGTERLLREASSGEVEQFVFASTMIVHAPCPPGRRIDEGSPLGPKWDYARSKLAAEQRLRASHGPIPLVILRIGCVYDAMAHHVLLAQQIRRVAERRLTGRVFPGDPSHGQAYLHLDDLLDALVRVVRRRRELPPESTLLLGEPDVPGYVEIQRELGRLLHGEDWPTRRIPKPLARFGARLQALWPLGDGSFIRPWMIDLADDHYALDITRARQLLGWEPHHSLRAELPELVAALRADPARWYRENDLEPPRHLEATDHRTSRCATGRPDRRDGDGWRALT